MLCGEESGLDAGERSLSTGTQVGDVTGSGGSVASNDQYLVAAGGQGEAYPGKERFTVNYQPKLVPSHPAALAAGQNHAGRLRSFV
jgi:hypothetical protein